MSSKSRRLRRSFTRRSLSPANADEPTHFMKIILPAAIHAQNMRIPKEFVRRFENELSTSEATVTVPDGRVWKMELKKSENEAWFCKGWEEFVKYYSICFGFFVVFKYEGNSQFTVVIFDWSAAEIYYPRKDNPEKQNSATECCKKRSPRLDQRGYNTRNQKHKLEDEEEIIDIDDDNALSHGKSGNKDRSEKELDNSRKQEKEKDKSGRDHSSRKKKRTSSKEQRALEAAHNFETKNKFFTATIRPSNLNLRYLDVPASFWKVNMLKMRPVKLQDCNGRKWDVTYVKQGSVIRIRKNWISFARANNLKEGDACVFELFKRKCSFVFKVHIFAC